MANKLGGAGTGAAVAVGEARGSAGGCSRWGCERGPGASTRFPGDGPDSYSSFTRALRDELAPRGVLEGLLVDQVARSAWRLRQVAPEGTDDGGDDLLAPGDPEVIAARSLLLALDAFESVRWRRPSEDQAGRPEAAAIDLGPEADGEDEFGETEVDSVDLWRGRLVLDPDVSEHSPCVQGTWVTVQHVVSLVVDGWTWADILRAHPELVRDDLRACLAFAAEFDGTDTDR